MRMHTKSAVMALAIFGALGAMTVGSIALHRDQPERRDPDQLRPQMSPEDRAAWLDARLAAMHAGLRLSAEQEKLWPSVEGAVREKAKIMMELWDKNQNAGRPRDPIDRLMRRGEADIARGQADIKMANAARPLWNTLTDQQKRRLERMAHFSSPDERHGRGDEPRRGPRGDREHGKGHDGGRPHDEFSPPPK